MDSMIVRELIDAVEGRLIAGRAETMFTGVSIDSRSLQKGDVFIAIVGKRFDGHSFVAEALRKGAAGAIVAREGSLGKVDGKFAVVMVKDTAKALQDLGAWHRRRFRCPVAAITGSNGKTTTKDLTWAILSRRYRTVRSEGSKNNHIGLPLTLTELGEEAEAAVVELGTSGFGEISNLVSISSPDVGCITNIGPAHLEFLGSVGNVARAKAELLEGMREGCPVVLNADDEWFEWLARKAKGPVVSFGIRRAADFMAEEVHAWDGAVSFRLVANPLGDKRAIRLPFPGAHNAYNAVAAAAISWELGVGTSDMEEGLAEARLPGMRYEATRLSGVLVVNDAYNANPVSTICALSSFCEMRVTGRRIFVCGDMLELGEYAREAHREVGTFVKGKPIDYVIALGELAPLVVEAAFRGGEFWRRAPKGGRGLRGERWACCRSVEEVVSVLREVAAPGDAVLIKGSRANGMERIVDALNAYQRSRRGARAGGKRSSAAGASAASTAGDRQRSVWRGRGKR